MIICKNTTPIIKFKLSNNNLKFSQYEHKSYVVKDLMFIKRIGYVSKLQCVHHNLFFKIKKFSLLLFDIRVAHLNSFQLTSQSDTLAGGNMPRTLWCNGTCSINSNPGGGLNHGCRCPKLSSTLQIK